MCEMRPLKAYAPDRHGQCHPDQHDQQPHHPHQPVIGLGAGYQFETGKVNQGPEACEDVVGCLKGDYAMARCAGWRSAMSHKL